MELTVLEKPEGGGGRCTCRATLPFYSTPVRECEPLARAEPHLGIRERAFPPFPRCAVQFRRLIFVAPARCFPFSSNRICALPFITASSLIPNLCPSRLPPSVPEFSSPCSPNCTRPFSFCSRAGARFSGESSSLLVAPGSEIKKENERTNENKKRRENENVKIKPGRKRGKKTQGGEEEKSILSAGGELHKENEEKRR